MELLKLLEELKNRRDRAKHIFDRENTEDGNKMLKNENWGKFTAYSHSIKHIEIIINNTPEVNKLALDDVSTCTEIEEKPIRYKCLLCGRDKFTQKTSHYCVGGYRKHKIKWQPIYE